MTLQMVGRCQIVRRPCLFIQPKDQLSWQENDTSDHSGAEGHASRCPRKQITASSYQKECLPECTWQQMLLGACISTPQAAPKLGRSPLTWSVAMAVNCTCGTDVRLTVSVGSTP